MYVYIYIYYIGSGKTYTMSSIYEATCDDIFNYLTSTVDRFNTKLPTVTMSFFEIAGDNCHDLLNQFHPTQLLSCSDGNVHAYPLTEPKVRSNLCYYNLYHHHALFVTSHQYHSHSQHYAYQHR